MSQGLPRRMFPPWHHFQRIGQGAQWALCCFWNPVTGNPGSHRHVSNKATEVTHLLSPTVQALGLELLGVEYLPAPGGATLRLYIDVAVEERDARVVNIEDCEAVSREVSAQLDVEDPISGNYTLEVSSPGVDRPLFALTHYERHAGESAKVVLKLPQDGRRRLQGGILRVDGDNVVFGVDGAELTVAFDNIDKARLVPDWVALGMAPEPKKKAGGASKPAPGKARQKKSDNKQPNQPAAPKKPRAK